MKNMHNRENTNSKVYIYVHYIIVKKIIFNQERSVSEKKILYKRKMIGRSEININTTVKSL